MTRLGYGLAKLPVRKSQIIDEEKSMEIIKLAIENGINIFDTSLFYLNGQSEEIAGKAISQFGNNCEISTKISLKQFNTEEEFLNIFYMQIKKLKKRYIDYYLIHGFDEEMLEKFNRLGVWKWINKLKDNGKIKNIGFSYHGNFDLLKKIVDLYNWDVCMIKFSPLDEEFETGKKGIEYLNEKNIRVFLMQPYFGGMYTDILDTHEKKKALLYKLLDEYKIDTIFIGTKSNKHLLENISIVKNYYKDNNVERNVGYFNNLKENYIKYKTIKCNGCDCCNICEQKVAIPYIFMIYNIYQITNNKKKFVYDYENIVIKHGNSRQNV